jgi:hypothetical protein
LQRFFVLAANYIKVCDRHCESFVFQLAYHRVLPTGHRNLAHS